MKYGVSLYSIQEDYFTGKRDLEGCFDAVANDIGATGIEYLPEQMPLKSYPNFTKADLDYWYGLLDKYHLEPNSMSAFLDYTMYSNRVWTYGERVEAMTEDLKRCKQLGFQVYRTSLLTKEDLPVFENCLPVAEDLGVQLAIEVHMPRSIHSWFTQDYLNILKRTGSKVGGFVIDFGIFATGLQLHNIEKFRLRGGDERFIDLFNAAYKNREALTEDDILKMGGGQAEIDLWSTLKVQIYDEPEWIEELLPYVKSCHGKFYGINEDGIDPSIDYENVIRILKKNNYEGYISCEYEAFRNYFTGEYGAYPDPVAECIKHHAMVDRYWNQF